MRRVLPAVAAAVLVSVGASGSGVALANPAPGTVVGRGNNGHGPLNVPAAALVASPAAPGEAIFGATYKGRFANGNPISFTTDKSGITSVSFDGKFKGSAPGTVGGTCWTQFQNPITFDPPLSIMGGAGHDDTFSGGVVPGDRHGWTFSGSFTGAQSARGTLKGGERDYGDPHSCVIDDQSWTATTTSLPPPYEMDSPLPLANLRVLRAGVSGGALNMLVEINRRAVCNPALGNNPQNCRAFLHVAYRSSRRTTKFSVWINRATLEIRRKLTSGQRQTNTGIVEITFGGSASVQPDYVCVRTQGQRFTMCPPERGRA